MIKKIDFLIYNILTKSKIKRVLDLGAGDGELSVYSASFGALIDAVDNRPFPNYLKNHPKINLINESLDKWKSLKNKKYDLVIMRSILHFLKPDIVFGNLLPEVLKSLNKNAFIYILTMTPPAESNRFNYSPEELTEFLKPLILCIKKEEKIEAGSKNHYLWRLVYQNIKSKNNRNIDFDYSIDFVG